MFDGGRAHDGVMRISNGTPQDHAWCSIKRTTCLHARCLRTADIRRCGNNGSGGQGFLGTLVAFQIILESVRKVIVTTHWQQFKLQSSFSFGRRQSENRGGIIISQRPSCMLAQAARMADDDNSWIAAWRGHIGYRYWRCYRYVAVASQPTCAQSASV